MADHMNFLTSMQATPLQTTMDAGDAAAETIDAGEESSANDRMQVHASGSRDDRMPTDIREALPRCGSAADIFYNCMLPRRTRSSATEIVEVTSGWNPLHLRDERDVELMTV